MTEYVFLAFLPFLLLGSWVLISMTLGQLSGWYALQERFPSTNETPLQRKRFQSAGLGKGKAWNPWGYVSYPRCLIFDICSGGLGVRFWGFAGFRYRPFLVPWDKISCEKVRILFIPFYRLSLGDPELSVLTIQPRTFEWIKASGLLR
jgi:hypothetical protein